MLQNSVSQDSVSTDYERRDLRAAQVALIRGENRYDNVSQALELISAQIDLSETRRVLIKPNFVVTHVPLAVTHETAVRAVLDFLRNRYNGKILIAEGPATHPAREGFRRFGYESLARSYEADLLDLNHDEPVPVEVYDWRLRPLRLHLARSVLESDFRISVGPPKTHDAVIVTLSLKNMIMGALISRFTHGRPSHNGGVFSVGAITKALWRAVPTWVRRLPPAEWLTFRAMSVLEPSDKMKMHQSYPVINLNLALLAPLVMPHLAVIDGFEAMEGNGPTGGTPVPLHLALASVDSLAADVVGTTVMGFDPEAVGYLHYCKSTNVGVGDLDRIEIVGNTRLADCVRPFQPHDSIERQRRWHLPAAKHYLEGRLIGTPPAAESQASPHEPLSA
jgi:uncharacterized protein (DUF362 family)